MPEMRHPIKIYLSFDMDYIADYDFLPRIFETIGSTPVTIFIAGSRHPENKYEFPPNVEIGNHTYLHEEWYGKPLEERIDDLEKNHQWIKEMYGVECTSYRSPHLRNFEDTRTEMVKRGYAPEMECAECPYCQPFGGHEHLKQYFSSHHFLKGQNDCSYGFIHTFEKICQGKKDFTFFLDAHHFPEDKLHYLTDLINIGKKYGQFERLSKYH